MCILYVDKAAEAMGGKRGREAQKEGGGETAEAGEAFSHTRKLCGFRRAATVVDAAIPSMFMPARGAS